MQPSGYLGIGNDLVSSNPAYQLAGGYLAGQGQGIAQQGNAAATALQNAGTVIPGMQEQAANLGLNAGYAEAGDLLSMQGIGLQEQGIAGQMGTAAQQQAITEQENPLNGQLLANTSAGAVSAGKYIGQEEQTSAQGYQEQMAALGLQQGNLNYQLPLAQQASAGQAAASGASNTVGQRNAQGTLEQQYQYNSGMLQNQGQQDTTQQLAAQQGYQQQGAQNALTQSSDYIQQQLGQLGQQSEEVGYQGQQGQYANQIAQLGLQSQQQGINVQQAQSSLAYGLGQLGIGAGQDINQYFSQAAGAEGQQQQLLGAAAANAGAATGVGAQTGYYGLGNT